MEEVGLKFFFIFFKGFSLIKVLNLYNCINLSILIHKEKRNMIKKKLVATIRTDGKWQWENLPNLNSVKKSYQRTPVKFVEEKPYLYLLYVDANDLQNALNAVLKITGSPYALVLILTKGQKGKEFNRHHFNISNNRLAKNDLDYFRTFETVIKNYGFQIGEKVEDGVVWVTAEGLPMTLQWLKKLYKSDKDKFYTIGKKIYFLRHYKQPLEQMFFRSAELSGGELELAKSFSSCETEQRRHKANFTRLGFNRTPNFRIYSKKLEGFLLRNLPLPTMDRNLDVY